MREAANMSATTIRIEDRTVPAAGLNLRYLEAGSGHPVIFLHGGSLGSSADVFLRNMPAFAKAGFRALAFDPTDNRVAQATTETTTFTISVDDTVASAVTDSATTVISTPASPVGNTSR
jgi:hypothetical protein